MSPITGMYRERLVDALTASLTEFCGAVSQLSQRELWKTQKTWRETFTPNALAAGTKWSDLWGPLAAGVDLTARDHAAVEAYAHRSASTFTIMLGYEEMAFSCASGRLPTHDWLTGVMKLRKLSDVYVIVPDGAWSFVVTSEQDSYGGPFFVDAAVEP